jgi:hypothetical protein
MRKVEAISGHIGYRHQLDRARRSFDRMQGSYNTDTDFQDAAWSFFQHCWHLKDWLRHDPLVPEEAKVSVLKRVRKSTVLQICRDLCNGSKHLVAKPARHLHTVTIVVANQNTVEHDCMIDDGRGAQMAGKAFASECLAEWEAILRAEGLAIARLS